MQETEEKAKNNIVEDDIVGGDDRIYEVGYLLVPTIPEADLPAMYGNLKDLVTTLGGAVISDEMPKKIPLAYSMLKVYKNVRNKFDTAYFGWVKFEINGDKVLEIKKKLDLDPNIIRFLITKTVKENTIAAKRFIHRDMTRRKMPTTKKEEGGIVTEIDKAEIDKEIDALVGV
jgi:ribosomal protein S6